VPRFGRVVLGGTFDRLHVGHEALLATAFRAGRSVAVGLTTDEYLGGHPKPDGGRIQPYRTRRAALRRWLSAHYPQRRWTLVPLNDPFGGSVEDGVDALVISAETVPGGRAVNAERRRRGRRTVPLLVVPIVLADDLGPVSSRRIRRGEIDRHGRRRSPIRVGLAVEVAADWAPAERGIRRVFPRAEVVPTRFQSFTHQSSRALQNSARAAARKGALGVAVGEAASRGRRVVVAGPRVALEPFTVRGRSLAAFSREFARRWSGSDPRKPFNPGGR
jgi:pantetheine-phosphate adenylyltransferase